MAREEIVVQSEDDVHDALAKRVLAEQLSAPGVIGEEGRGLRRVHRLSQPQEPELRLVRVAHQELHEIFGPARGRVRDDAIEVRASTRVLKGRRIHAVAERVIDLVVKDQRQPGQAKQQQEGGADQAGPLVHEVPGLHRRQASRPGGYHLIE